MKDFHARRAKARGMGGPERLARRRDAGTLNARERVERLLDAGSFLEVGTFDTSDVPGMEDETPADSKVGGLGRIDGRPVVVCSNDFTVLAATSSRVASHKEAELKRMAARRGMPIVYLAEAGGARMPDIMGSAGIASFGNSTYYGTRRRRVPMVTAVLGQAYGLPTWNACLSDFVVMLEGASMAVSGPRVLELATGEKISAEELGGAKAHAEETGFADAVGKTEDECFALVKRFLSYLPSHNRQAPPVAAVPAGSGAEMATIADLVPEARNRAYDMTRVLRRLADGGEIFPVKERFGRQPDHRARPHGRPRGGLRGQPAHPEGRRLRRRRLRQGRLVPRALRLLQHPARLPARHRPASSSAATPSASAWRARSSPGWRRSAWSRCRACPSSCARPTARPTSTWAAAATRTCWWPGPPRRCRSWTRPPA